MKVRVASAGTGKTTSLVRRYLELVDGGVALGRIAGVTFTRAAADELRQRVAAGVGEVLASGSYLGGYFTPSGGHRQRFVRARAELGGAVLSTIHGFMGAALRLSAPSLGLDPGFSVLGEWEAQAIFEEECAGLLMLAAEPGHPLGAAAEELGDDALELLAQVFAKRSLAPRLSFGATAPELALERLFSAALASYDARLGAASLSPGEVERRALRLLDHELARTRLVERFPRVLVDEYQDVNPLQGAFFERLAAAGCELELVGDPKQSIYGFRNADVAVFRRALDAAEAAGEVRPPLRESRRHAQAPVAFLNRLTEGLAKAGRGFAPREAPAVIGAGPQADVPGLVELHVVEGRHDLSVLRGREAELLAQRLRHHNERGVAYGEMAVLARSHQSLARVEAALRAAGVPGVVLQGRGYYVRSEIRDVRHALAVGADPDGPSLLPFLRGPFAGLTLAEIAQVASMRPEERKEGIARRWPAVAQRMERLAELARATPSEAVAGLLREPVLDGRRFQEYLPRRGRENVDALLFEVAGQAPRDVALLLARLDLLARKSDSGDVPQSGEGAKLLTIHASKGLEFRLVALHDVGAHAGRDSDTLLVEPGSGAVRLSGAPGFVEARAAALRRGEEEGHRLLYVAASRARDVLIMTGSVSRRAGQWLRALLDLGLEGVGALPGVSVERHPYAPPAAVPRDAPPAAASGPRPAPWLDERYRPSPLQPVVSPTALARLQRAEGEEGSGGGSDDTEEPAAFAERTAADAELEAGRVGWGRALGTLVHFAIGQDWRPADADAERTLRAQEVLFPFSDEQRDALVDEVLGLLGLYCGMLGGVLPAIERRSVDRAELPLAVRRGEVVWEGVVDRLYQVDGEWFLDDYKTDRTLAPERYHLQLGHYLDATERALGVRPRGRLVYLRHGVVVEPERELLEAALGLVLG